MPLSPKTLAYAAVLSPFNNGHFMLIIMLAFSAYAPRAGIFFFLFRICDFLQAYNGPDPQKWGTPEDIKKIKMWLNSTLDTGNWWKQHLHRLHKQKIAACDFCPSYYDIVSVRIGRQQNFLLSNLVIISSFPLPN